MTRLRSLLLALLPGFLAAAEDDHGLSDQLSAEAEALAPAFAAPAPAATTATARISLGEWGNIINWTPHIPVTAATLPDGRLLTFSSNQRTTFPVGAEFTYAAVWNPKTGAFTEINNTRHDMFCGGTVLLPDGRLLINGGRNTTRLSSIFDWRTNQWVAIPAMNDGRWYNTSVGLVDGSVFTVTGDGGTNTAERWIEGSGWSRLSGIPWQNIVAEPGYVTRWHPLILLAPDGRLFHGGPTRSMNWIVPTGSGSLQNAGASVPGALYPKEGCFAMYDEGRILVAGGSSSTAPNSADSSTGTSTTAAFTIDIRSGSPVVALTQPMKYARQFCNSVILPNGEVIVIGGNTSGRKFNDTGSILTPEIWNPATGQWRDVAPMNVPRNYHSLALLLPDGRVWSGGGGLSGNSADHRDAQIFTPPQLYTSSGALAVRPQITAAPSAIGSGQVFEVRGGSGISRFTFIKMSSQTHSVNTDLRFIELPFTSPSDGVYAVSARANLSVMTPGYWMLFAHNAAGVYSEARVIQVSASNSPSLVNPGPQISRASFPASLQIAGSGLGTLTYSASGLPAGLSINPSTGLISGTITAAPGLFNVTVTLGSSLNFSSAVSFSWTVNPPTAGSGSILREVWSSIAGNNVADLTANPAFSGTPSSSMDISSFESPANAADNYGQRVRGWLHPRVSGAYRFWIAGDDECQLRLSTSDSPANAVLIARVPQGFWSDPRQWTKFPEQASALVNLVAGQRYYIEALHKEGVGGDHLAVAWQPPGDSGPVVVEGQFLSPWTPNRPPTLANPGPRSAVVGSPASLQLSAGDPDNNTLSFSASGLPPGLSLNPSSGLISGTPTSSGAFSVTVSASDLIAPPVSASFTWTVSAALSLNPLLTSPLQSNTTATFTASATGGLNPRFRWTFGDGSPASPYSSSPSISRAYTQPGHYIITVEATDDTGRLVSRSATQVVHPPLTAKRPSVSSPILFEPRASGNSRVWVVNPDNDSVSAFDAVTRARLAEIPVGKGPRSLALAPDGRLWVANTDAASLSILNTTTLAVAATLPLPRGSRPFGLAFDPGGSAAFLALEASGRLLKLNPSTGAIVSSQSVGLHARHVSISADSSRIYLSRFITPHLPGENSASISTSSRGGEILVLSASSLALERTLLLAHSEAADSPTSARGIPNYLGPVTLSPDGASAWIPSKQDNIKRGSLRDGLALNHDQTVRAIASRLDLVTQAELPSARIDFDDAGMPSAALFDATGSHLFVALESSRAVAIVDPFSNDEIARFDVGRAPQGLALSADGRSLFVHNFMDRSISVVDLQPLLQGTSPTPAILATLNTVAAEKLPAPQFRGKQLFYDAFDPRLALQRYISCASCHNEGGHDGRTWDFTGFGEGLRNTITLRGHGLHGPLHWSGNFDEFHDFEGQIRGFAGGTGLMTDAQFNTGSRSQPLGDPKAGLSADLDALAAYLASLATEADSPHRTPSGSLTADALAGEQIFRARNCASCHSGDRFTNSALNVFADIGTRKPASGKRLNGSLSGFDVPTLRGLWATAPYLHDGSAPTLGDAVRAHSGTVISDTELAQLAAYLSQIDSQPATAPLPVTVELTSSAPASVSSPFSVTATFSHPVTGLALSDFAVTGATLSALSGSGATYTLQVSPSAAVTLSLPAGSAADASGLGNLASSPLTRSFLSPAPVLVGQNIGTASVSGSSSFDSATGIHTLRGAGSDIFFTEDGFRFEQLLLTGDGEIRARVRSFDAVNPWAKAGVMIRESAAPGSRHVTAFITPPASANGFGAVCRTLADGSTTYAQGPGHNTSPNNWVRLVRSGSTLSASASADGVSWSPISSFTLSGLPSQVLIGLAVTSSDTSALATATFDQVQITGTQSVLAPSVTLSSASSLESGPFTVAASFSQPVTGLTLSDFTVTNASASNLAGSAGQYTLTLAPQSPGPVTIQLPAAAALSAASVPSLPSNTLSVTFQPPAAAALQGQDIGSVRVPGSTSSSGGAYSLSGSGSDIFFTADGFHFALVQLVGDGEIRARVTSQTNSNPWAKAGVMIRESLSPSSRHALMFTTPAAAGNGFGFVSRSSTGGATSYTGGPPLNPAPNNWVRLVRSGSTLSAFTSANGTAWSLVGSATLSGLASPAFIGLAVTSSSPDVLSTATFDNVQVVGSQAVVAPAVTLSSASSTESGPFSVQLTFTQPVTGLALSDFIVTNASLSNLSGSGSSYSLTVTPLSPGSVSLSLPAAAATNGSGTPSTASNTLTVSFIPPAATVFRGTDVGGVVVPGSYSLNAGTHSLAGAGSDIFFTSDGFHYAVTRLVGDGEIRARVTSQTSTNPWAKAGVMIRESLSGGGRHATAFTTPASPGNGFGLVFRPLAEGATSYAGGPALNAAPNNWLRLVRSGSSLSAFTSANGTAWTQFASASLSGLAETVFVGLAVTSASPFVLGTATFDNVQVVGTQSALPEGFTAPVESLTTPDADFNNNGVNDLVEYAVGAANRPDANWWLSSSPDGRIDAHALAPESVTDVTYSLESTSNLADWQRLPMAPVSTSLADGWRRLSWIGISSLQGQTPARGVVRLHVAQTGGTSAAAPPQAWQRHSLQPGAQTFGVSLVSPPLFSGVVDALSDDFRLTISTASPFTLPPGTPAYFEILDGEHAGHRVELASAQTGLLTADPASPLSTLKSLPANLLGAQIIVRTHLTLGAVFASAGLHGGLSSAQADQVLFHTPQGWQTHWLMSRSSLQRWVLSGDATLADTSATVIPPGSGLMVKLHAASPGAAFTLTGHVRTTPFHRPLLVGNNLLACPWPLDGTPDTWQLHPANGFTATTSPSSSDQIQVWSGSSYQGLWLMSFGTGSRWTALGGTDLLDLGSSLPLPSHRAFFLKAQPATAAKGWNLAPPRPAPRL